MISSGMHSQSFIKPKISLPKSISRCSSSASAVTRSSSSASNKTVLISSRPKPPKISASSYCVYNMARGFVISSKKDLEPREIASLTKIMTLYTVLNIIEEKRGKGSLEDIVKISKLAANTTGTSAGLAEGDLITVKDLLYALMLPSGNDAAWALAEYFGGRLGGGAAVSNFLNEMNYNAKKLGLCHTSFGNPHGLTLKRNLSTAREVCKLATAAMKNLNFQKIVRTKIHKACVQGSDEKVVVRTWENTNKLLEDGWSGIKTGITNKAGPCLCSSFDKIVIVLLNSRTMEDRWVEARTLASLV